MQDREIQNAGKRGAKPGVVWKTDGKVRETRGHADPATPPERKKRKKKKRDTKGGERTPFVKARGMSEPEKKRGEKKTDQQLGQAPITIQQRTALSKMKDFRPLSNHFEPKLGSTKEGSAREIGYSRKPLSKSSNAHEMTMPSPRQPRKRGGKRDMAAQTSPPINQPKYTQLILAPPRSWISPKHKKNKKKKNGGRREKREEEKHENER